MQAREQQKIHRYSRQYGFTHLTRLQAARHKNAAETEALFFYATAMTHQFSANGGIRQGGRPFMPASLRLRVSSLPSLRSMWAILLGCLSLPTAWAERPASYTLVINMTPAMCMINPNLQRLRQCQEGFSLTVSSLRPESSSGKAPENCSQTRADLPPLQERIVERVMPDEQLRDKDWQRTGSCTGMSARTYFRTIANYAGRLRVPPELSAEKEVVVYHQDLTRKLVELNSGLSPQSVLLHCSQSPSFQIPLLTQVKVCYTPDGQYTACPVNVQSNCPTRFIVHGTP